MRHVRVAVVLVLLSVVAVGCVSKSVMADCVRSYQATLDTFVADDLKRVEADVNAGKLDPQTLVNRQGAVAAVRSANAAWAQLAGVDLTANSASGAGK